MADEFDESCLDLSEFTITDVIRLQAVCRGWLVRKQMKTAQAEFLQIVSELDGAKVDVEWRGCGSSISHPVVKRGLKKTRPQKINQADKVYYSSTGCKCNTNKVCLKPEDSKYFSVDELPASQENSLKNIESNSKRTQDSPKTQADQDIKTDLKVPLSKEESASRGECEEVEAQHTGGDLHHKSGFYEKVDSHPQADDIQLQAAHGFVVGDGGDAQMGASMDLVSPEPENIASSSSVSKTPVSNDTSETATATVTPIITLTPTSHTPGASSDKSGGEAFSEVSSKGKIDSFHGDQTSVWNSSSSVTQDHDSAKQFHAPPSPSKHQLKSGTSYPSIESLRSLSTEELLKQRQNVAMEVLWVQQAIISRKKYLHLRNQMQIGT